MKTTLSLCIAIASSLVICGCQSLPRISNTGVGHATVQNAKPKQVLAVARRVYLEEGYRSVPSDSANSLSFDKSAGAFKGIDWSLFGNVKCVRVTLSAHSVSDAQSTQLEQKAYSVSSSGITNFRNVIVYTTLWNSELGSILAKIVQQSSNK